MKGLATAGVQRAAIVAVALLISMIVFARGFFTPMGIASFGREFGFYVSYFDFGFVHRALIGSIVSLFAPGPIANSYINPVVVYPVFLIFAALFGLFAARRWFPDTPERTRYLAVLLLSPAFVTHYAYSAGDFNVLLTAILIASLLLVRHRFAPFLLLPIAMAIHEIYFVAFAPCVCVAMYVADDRRLRRAVAYGVIAAILFFVFARFGTIDMSQDQYHAIMDRRVKLSYNAYVEMSGDFNRNVEFTRPLFNSFGKIAWTIPLFVYWAIVTILFFPKGQPRFLACIYLAAAASPLVLFPFGTDLFRWVSLASVVAILLGGFLRAEGCDSLFVARPRLALALTLPWVLVGPFGSPCDATAGCFRPFPMQQFVAERLVGVAIPGAR
jgi:hypothetical protein